MVSENNYRYLLRIPFGLRLDSRHGLRFYPKDPHYVNDSADGTYQYGKQHTARAGIYVKINHPNLRSLEMPYF
jgi:hypothetical protein